MNGYMNSMSYNMIHLCLDEWCNQQIGNAYNTTLKEPIVFHDIIELILKIDAMFNRNGNPQASQMKRSFLNDGQEGYYHYRPHTYTKYQNYLQFQGKLGTFDIVVKSRRQASWQGFLFCFGKADTFQNIVELVNKIEAYLDN